MKKLLGFLGTITIAGSGVAGLVGNAPTLAKNNINYQQTNNLKNLNRSKRETKDEDYIDYQLFVFESDRLYVAISQHTWQAIKNIHDRNLNNYNEYQFQTLHLVSNFRRDNRADASSNNAIVKAIWNHFDTLETSYQRTNYHVGLRFVINHNSKLFESGEQRYN